MILVAAVLVVAAVAGMLLFDRTQADRLVRSRRHRKLVVELKSGDTFDGLLDGCDRHVLVLRNPRMLVGPQSQPTHIDGELLIPRGDVKFIQRP